ncbi:uncharacterized protein A4U43_C09F11880 [Asparagus officinalis]|uniref:NTF2 domain-containing protein n=1 Tax=Asparagus officinalis TaxID=4686 RepID=A0A5P1E6Z3_ASPOF|nr:uncharacterized protein A4U43_C09F11880 [Asparagus officinalis]
MASDQSVAVGSQPPPSVVGNAFVQQFYRILHQSPHLVHRFYQESSKLGRVDGNGVMDSVTTLQAIHEKIVASGQLTAEIKTVDAQDSLNGGVIVLVTGYLTGIDLGRKNFTQTFFLAPQDKGYFVLNDIFRYVAEGGHQMENAEFANGTFASLSSEQHSPPREQAIQEQMPPPKLEEEENGEEVYNPPQEQEDPAIVEEAPEEEVVDEVSSIPQMVVAVATPASTVHEEAPKKSYASIVKVMKENPAPLSVPNPSPARPKPDRHSTVAPRPAQVPEPPADRSNGAEDNNPQEAEADGYSIYIKSLPLSATPAQLEEEFKKFGPIRPGGIQVRSHKMQGFCFGFVQFEVASAVQSAIEASPVVIGGRQAFVEEKRPTAPRASTRGRSAPGRVSGFRGDGPRGRGSYGSGRGSFGRGDYNNRGDFGNRGGGRANHGGDVGYHSGGRGNRSGSFTGNSSPKNVAPGVPAPA